MRSAYPAIVHTTRARLYVIHSQLKLCDLRSSQVMGPARVRGRLMSRLSKGACWAASQWSCDRQSPIINRADGYIYSADRWSLRVESNGRARIPMVAWESQFMFLRRGTQMRKCASRLGMSFGARCRLVGGAWMLRCRARRVRCRRRDLG